MLQEVEQQKIPRAPYHAFKRAIEREARLMSKINRAIVREGEKKINHLFRVYYDNENLMEKLREMMRGDNTVNWSH